MYRTPSLPAQPGPPAPRGGNRTLQCGSEAWSDPLHLSKEGSLAPPQTLRLQDTAPPFRATFTSSPVTSAHSGTYTCYSSLSTSPSLMSQPSDPRSSRSQVALRVASPATVRHADGSHIVPERSDRGLGGLRPAAPRPPRPPRPTPGSGKTQAAGESRQEMRPPCSVPTGRCHGGHTAGGWQVDGQSGHGIGSPPGCDLCPAAPLASLTGDCTPCPPVSGVPSRSQRVRCSRRPLAQEGPRPHAPGTPRSCPHKCS
ncbi:leukocyte immunoglobulin-like receptor subfamily B member 4 isoform X2 [Kogia breviceps]